MRGVKTCPQCETGNGPRTRICSSCGYEFKTLMERKHIAAVAKSQTTQANNPVAAPIISPAYSVNPQEIQYLRNLVKDHEKTIGRLESQVHKLRGEIDDWKRWKAEKIYNSALNRVVDALKLLMDNSDVEKLSKILTETQAYMSPVGEKFFHKDGTAKVIHVSEPMEQDNV